ncbi:MAG: hypothetical protein VB066_01870 [Paludibacter sp.]|nr:hypothetical protein [Paludibacter sp.]
MNDYKMIDNLIQKVNELNKEGCFNDYSDYSYLIDELNKLKELHECKLNTAMTALSGFRIDVLVSSYIAPGVAKMIVNVADFNNMQINLHEKLNKNTEPHTPQN